MHSNLKTREALEYGHRQLGISEELDSPSMRAEAYLNLARAHERLGGLERYFHCARLQCNFRIIKIIFKEL